MKWRNGKFEKVLFTEELDEPLWSVVIFERSPSGCFVITNIEYFFNRPTAVAFASKHRLSRMYPGRLMNGGEIYE